MNETMNPPRCPSPEELRAFAVGDLCDTDIDRIAGHVLDCEPCDRALRSLDEMTDGLLRSLNGFSPNAQLSAPLPEALLRVARSAAGSGDPRRAPSCSDSCPDVSLDSGRRLARMLGEGACRLGRFELEAELGVGSFGHVFRARDTELDRR